MKTKFFIWLVLTAISVNATAFSIAKNTVFSIGKQTHINLTNLDLKNDGFFVGDTNSTLIISSNREQKISGNDMHLASLKINGHVISDVKILSLTADLTMQSGVFNIENNQLIIDGNLLDETEHTYVFASTGTIEKTIKHLFAGQHNEVFGLQFSSANDIFDLKITRSHNPIVRMAKNSENRSVRRVYDFCTPINISDIRKQILPHETENIQNPTLFVHDFEDWKKVNGRNDEFFAVLRVSTFSPDHSKNQLVFPKIVMPNHHQKNVFVIEGLEEYPNSRLVILSKKGKLLHDFFPYENNFDGRNLPCGTYYYMFSENQNTLPMKKSFFEIVR